MAAKKKNLSDADYTRLANFRYALRCFLEFSENAAGKEGLTPQQHQALLVIRASPPGMAKVGRLAERLRIRPNSAVELANRLEASGLVRRESVPEDRRAVLLALTEDGAARLERLTHIHRAELAQLKPEIAGFFENTGLEKE